MSSPVIVVGSPFSGTSVVARLLQTDHGVMMDEGPIKKDKYKPKGYYEDIRILEINRIGLRHIMFHGNENMSIKWVASLSLFIQKRQSKYHKWGFKDPGCVSLIKHMHQFFENPAWIICKRSDDQVLESFKKRGDYALDLAKRGLRSYQTILDRELNGNGNIVDLTKYVSEPELSERLGGILNGKN